MPSSSTSQRAMTCVYDFTATGIDGQEISLADFRGQVLLIVNVASRCGFTPQYSVLEELYRKYQPQGFAVLGFPCDQFLHQEPGNEAEIKNFCSLTYDVTFPLFARVHVNGAQTHPLFVHLKAAQRGLLGTGAIKWNFTKFLINRQGRAVQRFSPRTVDKLEPAIQNLLSAVE
jgi:glutathione peroxidase